MWRGGRSEGGGQRDWEACALRAHPSGVISLPMTVQNVQKVPMQTADTRERTPKLRSSSSARSSHAIGSSPESETRHPSSGATGLSPKRKTTNANSATPPASCQPTSVGSEPTAGPSTKMSAWPSTWLRMATEVARPLSRTGNHSVDSCAGAAMKKGCEIPTRSCPVSATQ